MSQTSLGICLSRRSLLFRTLTIGASAALLACQRQAVQPTLPTTSAPAKAGSKTSVRVASLRTFAEAGVYVAQERGYFAAQGLDVTFSELNARDLLSALGSGQVDVGGSAVTSGLFNAIARDLTMRLVAPLARMDPGASPLFWMVRKDLFESNQFNDYSDLAGKKIAAASVGGTADYLVSLGLQRAGLKSGSADTVLLDFPEMTAALASHAVDVALQTEPTATISVERGVAVKWRDVSDLAPGLQNTVLIFGPNLIARQADIGNQWMEAHLKGVRDYYAALLKNGADREAIVSILSRWTPVADPQLYTKMAFPYIDPNGMVNRDSLADLLRFFRDSGRISGSVDLEHVLDTRFVDSAVRKLGWYSV